MDADWAKTYAAMDDGELVALAAESDELVEEAHTALWNELRRRGLEREAMKVYEKVGTRDISTLAATDSLVTVMVFDNHVKASLAKNRLESEGISCFLADEHIVRLYWSFGFGGIKLQVSESDADSAARILREHCE